MWGQCVLVEYIGGEFGLGEKLVPEVFGKGGVYSGEDGNEVGFEGVDGLFSGVAEMNI